MLYKIPEVGQEIQSFFTQLREALAQQVTQMLEDQLDHFIITHCADLNKVKLPESILKYQRKSWKEINLFQMVNDYLDFENEREKPYTDFLNMPVEKLKNAGKHFLFPARKEKILFIVDTSLLQNAKEGFAMTEHALYWKFPLQKARLVNYERLETLKRVENWITINGKYFHVSTSIDLKMLKLLKRIRLIRKGYKVAICEQTENPEEARQRAKAEGKPVSKALVNRDVVRVVTQGTLTEDSLLNARENNYLCAAATIGGQYGLAWAELSTGEFCVQPVSKEGLGAAIERLQAREILTSEATAPLLHSGEVQVTIQPSSLFDSENARKRLEAIYGVETLESFGGFSRAEIAAAGALIDYIERTQIGKIPRLDAPRQLSSGAAMEIDAATRRNLELTRTLSGERSGSLLACIDKTITGAGSRMLQACLSSPLTDIDKINQRLDRVTCFVESPAMRSALRDQLKTMPDMERALGRLSVGRGSPRDLAAIRSGLAAIELIRGHLVQDERAKAVLGDILEILRDEPALSALLDTLRKALPEEPPALLRDGGFIAKGYDSALDKIKLLRDESRRLIAGLQEKYRKISGVDSLKIKHNNVLGYFIEVTSRHGDALMVKKGDEDNPFIHRQTMANAVRFTTADLSELERDMASAAEKSLALELEIFDRLLAQTLELADAIGLRARAVAALDVAAGLAELAEDMDYTRPGLYDDTRFEITGGRHPVVEQALKKTQEAFVPNDCNLGYNEKLWLLTGPNMAGKSTFLRQNALIAILAQAGSFVPAKSADIGIIDRVFSRVGASDDLARGRSTFMVEMVETAAILNQATEKSLVILDEIGRGTATFDGLSIAWACVEHLHEVNACRALFATHYHELTSLTSKLDNLSCHAMQVKEWKGEIIFLHSVGGGSADRSYGIHVARIAGIPGAVISRAEDILEMLQTGEQSGNLAKLANDLPLFSAQAGAQADKSAGEPDPLAEKLAALNPDEMSPKEALEALYELKKASSVRQDSRRCLSPRRIIKSHFKGGF